MPTWQSFIHWSPTLSVVRHIFCALTVLFVGHAHLDFFKRIQHIRLHHHQVRHTVHHNGIFQCHKVYPTTTAVATGHSTKLFAHTANLLACLVKQFHGERTTSHTSGVGFENTPHTTNALGSNAQARANTANGGRRGRHKWISAVIDVQQRTLCTLCQHVLSFCQSAVNLVFRVGDGETAHIVDAFQPRLFLLRDVEIGESQILQNLEVTCFQCFIFG